jgi:hypothetical protein
MSLKQPGSDGDGTAATWSARARCVTEKLKEARMSIVLSFPHCVDPGLADLGACLDRQLAGLLDSRIPGQARTVSQ